jgi:hypothetical protein
VEWDLARSRHGPARDPNLAAAYSTYVIYDDGDVQRIPYTADPDGVAS